MLSACPYQYALVIPIKCERTIMIFPISDFKGLRGLKFFCDPYMLTSIGLGSIVDENGFGVIRSYFAYDLS